MCRTRTLVVDDDVCFRRRVGKLLSSDPDILVIGEAGDGGEAISKARQLQPDLILMDVRMPGTNGIIATRELKGEMPDVRVIVLTTYDIDEYREAAAVSGADGYVVKKALIEALLPTIRDVCVGQRRHVGAG